MATRAKGVNITTANLTTTVDTVGASGGTYSIQIVNRSADSDCTVQLGLSTTTSFEDARRILHNESLSAGAQMTYSPIVCEGSDNVLAQASITNVNFLLMGHDEA